VCGDRQVDLAAGTHDVSLVGDDLWRPVRATLTTPEWAPAASPDSIPVDADPGSRGWDAEIPAGSTPGLLTVRQNANDGWQAEAEDQPLPTVDVDGWMQGYRVPGGATEVAASFAPARANQVALLGGLLLLVALIVGACVPTTRAVRRPLQPDRLGAPAAWTLVAVAALLLGGWTGLVAAVLALAAVSLSRRVSPGRTGQAYVIVAGGIAAFLLIAGVLAAWPPVDADTSGLRWTIQLCCLIAVLAVAVVATGRLEVQSNQEPVEARLEQPRDRDADGNGENEDVAG
jgi:arabinofuranan 3-O-arabinosyltransferase